MQVSTARAIFSALDCAIALHGNDSSSSVANTRRIAVPVYFRGLPPTNVANSAPGSSSRLDHSRQRELEIVSLGHGTIVTHPRSKTGVPWCQSRITSETTPIAAINA